MNCKQLNIKLSELSFVDKAEDIAQLAHIGQTRRTNNIPYIIHPKRIQLLAKELKYGTDAQIVSLLHDVIENSKNPNSYKQLILSKFGDKIYNAIILLSHDKSVPYNSYLEKLAMSSSDSAKLAFKVKMLDMYDNLRDNPTKSQYTKYENSIRNLFNKGIKYDIPTEILNILGIIDESVILEAPENKNDTKDKKSDDVGSKNSDTGENDIDSELNKSMSSSGDSDIGNITSVEEPGDVSTGEENDAENEKSITYYNDKLGKSKIIAKQRLTQDPGCSFDDIDYYNDNYVSQTPTGSLMIAVPDMQNPIYIDFVKETIMPKIIKVVYESIKIGKNVVLMGNNGLPYYNGKYDSSTCGKIAITLSKKFKNNILYDTWNPKYFYSFTSNVEFWNEFKSKTGVSDAEMKCTLYLFLLLFENNNKISSMKNEGVDTILLKWGLNPEYLNPQTHEDDIKRILFPDIYGNAETEASYIIKMYLHMLRVNLIKKVVHHEKKGNVCIVPVDSNTSWILHDSFENLDNISKPKKTVEKKTNKKPESDKNAKN